MPIHSIEEIQNRFIREGWTLSVAESCTGGYLSSSLTAVSGCSAYYLGGVIAYSNNLKVNLLGVKSHDLEKYGAVSGEVARQMAEGVLRLTGSDYSIAVTGIAGPIGGTLSKPIGTVWAAVSCMGKETFIWDFHLTGNREEIIKQTTASLLDQLWLLLN